MVLELLIMTEQDIPGFKRNIQEAFQKGFEDVFGKCEETILPEKDIDQSLNGKGATAYKAALDGETVGGVIVAIDEETLVLDSCQAETILCGMHTLFIAISILLNYLHGV